VLFLLVLIPSGCMGGLAPATETPASLGAQPVGVTTWNLRDDTRDRELAVEVWYPAADRPLSGEPETYAVRAGGIAVARLRSVADARRDVRPQTGGPRPVVLMSHGAGSTRYGNVGLAEVLASHGYIVAAPDHDGHTVADKLTGISDDDRARSAYDRPLDLTAVLDELARRSKSGNAWRGTVDMDRVAVAGHSFGGRTAMGIVGASFDGLRQSRECAEDDDDRRCRAVPVFGERSYRYRDSRIKAALLITPAGYLFYRQDGVATIDAPVLVVAAHRDETVPYAAKQQPLFGAFTSPHYVLDLARAGHLTATDVCGVVESIGFLANAFGGDRAKDGCGEGFLSTRTTLDLVANAALPFFELHLSGQEDADKRLQLALHPVIVDGPRLTAMR
jgi:predicted dienelactone hydrolase